MAFVLSKILWMLLAPSGLLVFGLGAGVFMLKSSKPDVVRWGRRLCSLVFAFLVVVAVFPVGDWALTPLEGRFSYNPPEQVSGIIVIGGDEDGLITEKRGTPTAITSASRYLRFAELSRQYPDARLVFSGGSGRLMKRSSSSEARVALRLIESAGVSSEKITVEDKSRNTYENATLSANIIKPDSQQNWLLVTSAWHMPRAIGCFRQAGWNVYAAPVGFMTSGEYSAMPVFDFLGQLNKLTTALHEYVGLISYRIMGRIGFAWPG